MEKVVFLDTQFRMRKECADYNSEEFYGGLLKSSPSAPTEALYKMEPPNALVLVESTEFVTRGDGSAKTANTCQIVMNKGLDAIDHLKSKGANVDTDTALLSPYSPTEPMSALASSRHPGVQYRTGHAF